MNNTIQQWHTETDLDVQAVGCQPLYLANENNGIRTTITESSTGKWYVNAWWLDIEPQKGNIASMREFNTIWQALHFAQECHNEAIQERKAINDVLEHILKKTKNK